MKTYLNFPKLTLSQITRDVVNTLKFLTKL